MTVCEDVFSHYIRFSPQKQGLICKYCDTKLSQPFSNRHAALLHVGDHVDGRIIASVSYNYTMPQPTPLLDDAVVYLRSMQMLINNLTAAIEKRIEILQKEAPCR